MVLYNSEKRREVIYLAQGMLITIIFVVIVMIWLVKTNIDGSWRK